ncbi:hypothetical protein ABT255_30295 [Streptomyces mirabilis]|uniref:hypothetical protein n=1 Tax=Streptomyces mirabilis TaxID=68239 RepID=UPI0033325EF9
MTTAGLSVTASTKTRQVETADRPVRPATEARLTRLGHEATAHVENNRPRRQPHRLRRRLAHLAQVLRRRRTAAGRRPVRDAGGVRGVVLAPARPAS